MHHFHSCEYAKVAALICQSIGMFFLNMEKLEETHGYFYQKACIGFRSIYLFCEHLLQKRSTYPNQWRQDTYNNYTPTKTRMFHQNRGCHDISKKNKYGCVWKCLPPFTQWFCWSLSLLNGYFIGNIPYFHHQTHGHISRFQLFHGPFLGPTSHVQRGRASLGGSSLALLVLTTSAHLGSSKRPVPKIDAFDDRETTRG